MDYIVIFITAPNDGTADTIARTLVEERLAACVNIIRGIRSVYTWQGKVEYGDEALLVAKTRRSLFEGLSARVKELHPYTVPEVIALPIVEGLSEYTSWIGEVTG